MVYGDFDVDFGIDDEFFSEEPDLEPDYDSVMYDNLIYDALNHNLVHLEMPDIDRCFEGGDPRYFEAETIPDVVDYVKSAKIKAMLLFVKADILMCELTEAIDALKPYCTEECLENGKILFGTGDETTKDCTKFRALFVFGHIEDEKTENKSDFGEDIPF